MSGGEGKMLGLSVKQHKRSKSFPEKKRVEEDDLDGSGEASDLVKLDMGQFKGHVTTKKKQSPTVEVHNSLKQEIFCTQILQLEKRLQDQFKVRHALENSLGYRSSIHHNTNASVMPKPATELIKEIAVLELEVAHLEQYLLSLYRRAFDGKFSSVSPSKKDERLKPTLTSPRIRFLEVSEPDMPLEGENLAVQSSGQSLENSQKEFNAIGGEEKLLDSSVHRCHSSLSQRSAFLSRTSPEESLANTLRSCHSQPLSMMEYAQNTSSNLISLAEHLGTRIADHIPETPNRLSEDMIKCMSTIYCKLSETLLSHNGLSSPNSSLSSTSAFSPRDQSDMWSPRCRNNSSFDVRLDNPFHIEGLKEFSGPYSTMVEVPWIYRDSKKLGDIEHLLQHFRSLICRLEEVDPRKLENDEKLAFWINVHNTLVMHAYLAYGVPQNNVKRVFLLLKAAYNIGGHTISADTMQSSILGCRMSCPGQYISACSGFVCYLLQGRSSRLEMNGKHMQLTIRNPFYTLHCVQEAILILRFVYTHPRGYIRIWKLQRTSTFELPLECARTTKFFYRRLLRHLQKVRVCVQLVF
ncbi:uncharacterized protein [Malus domestica]|uniref:uncharacterized protein isoform X3 n=1 Tax=Malus domestica TaxID=3750 RepID=UPI0039754771